MEIIFLRVFLIINVILEGISGYSSNCLGW